MPMYEYACANCGAVVELLQKMGVSEAGVPCPACGGADLKKKLSVSAPARKVEGGPPCQTGSAAPQGCGGCCGSCR